MSNSKQSKTKKRKPKDSKNWVTRKILATNVCYLRHQQGLSQYDLAEKCGRSVYLISDIENAKKGATIDAIDDIGKILGWTTSQLTEDHGFKVTKKRVDEK